MSQTFQKKKEDFTCEKCGTKVQGSGYTNHCPNCLWSKHVDQFPGDRTEECGGMMEPMGVESKGKDFRLRHRCVQCGTERLNKISASDNQREVARISSGKSFN